LKFESSRVRAPARSRLSLGKNKDSGQNPASAETISPAAISPKCQGFAKKSCSDSKNTLSESLQEKKRRHVRNAGHRNFYRRGRVYYRLKHDVWTSLRTTNRREGLKRLRELEALELAGAAMQKLEVVGRLSALEERILQVQATLTGDNSLAPRSAKEERGDFVARLDECISRMQDLSAQQKRCGGRNATT
jgi:hypothetical protein